MICFSICRLHIYIYVYIYIETGKNTRIILLCSLAPAPTLFCPRNWTDNNGIDWTEST
jgi:hypothetical protein